MATKPPAKTAPVKPAAKAAAPATSTAVAKRTASNVVSIREALAAQAAKVGDQLGSVSGINISLAGKKFALPDGRKSADPLQVVIVGFVSANVFYEGEYDSNNIAPPTCFAIHENPRSLTPSDNSPVKQNDSCMGCPMNEFGSKGKGKACANTRLLAVLPPDADADSPIWTMKVSPTGLKAFDAYVRQVSSMFQTTPVGVVTTISFDDDKDFPTLQFGDPVLNDNVAEHFGRQAEASKILEAEPDVSGYAAPVAKKPARAAARR